MEMSAPRTGLSRKPLAEDHETNAESEAKRRKIRKGTHSCWECKRRKMKCIFESTSDTTCTGCQRRGSKCVSQELHDGSTLLDRPDRMRLMDDRLVKVETLIGQLVQKVNTGNTAEREKIIKEDNNSITISNRPNDSESSDFSQALTSYKSSKDDKVGNKSVDDPLRRHKLKSSTNSPAGAGKYEALSRVLYKALPSPEEMESIYEARGRNFFHGMFTSVLKKYGLQPPDSLLDIPGPKAHPVLLARCMLHLATFIQHLHPDAHNDIEGLSESPRTIMKRLANIAISLVTTNDEILGSIEGVECVMMEAIYQANFGNIRRSSIAIRRAMIVAQLVGLHRNTCGSKYKVLDPNTNFDPQYMWFRIVYCDRQYSLLLGLPQGSLDYSTLSETRLAEDTSIGRLERAHCILASHILERNESKNTLDCAITQQLDMELQKVAKTLPSKWWLTPNLNSAVNDPLTQFLETRRLVDQLVHYNTLNQLHLPHMIRSTECRSNYSKIICANASREMLSRFIVLRTFNRNSHCYRTVDFFSLMAAMTLLLAHLDSHRFSQKDNPLAHQSLSDRAMIEQAQQIMEDISLLNGDPLNAQSADLLRRLLAIEAEAADGCTRSAESVSVNTPEAGNVPNESHNETQNGVVCVWIPYFGIIKIAREGFISKQVPKLQFGIGNENQLSIVGRSNIENHSKVGQPFSGYASGHFNAQIMTGINEGSSIDDLLRPVFDNQGKIQDQIGEFPTSSTGNSTTQLAPQFLTNISDALLQQDQYPEPVAGAEDWAFQGVDMAFFDSLIRGVGDGNIDPEWPWPNGASS